MGRGVKEGEIEKEGKRRVLEKRRGGGKEDGERERERNYYHPIYPIQRSDSHRGGVFPRRWPDTGNLNLRLADVLTGGGCPIFLFGIFLSLRIS